LLLGGVAQINLAANTEYEMQEKKDRIEDALSATRAAIEEGIVPGGGVALLRSAEVLNDIMTENKDQEVGVRILQKALEMPARCIIENAGEPPTVMIDKILLSKNHDHGYNAASERLESLTDAGVIDPTKVTRLALENAVSVAGMMLITYCVVADEEEKI